MSMWVTGWEKARILAQPSPTRAGSLLNICSSPLTLFSQILWPLCPHIPLGSILLIIFDENMSIMAKKNRETNLKNFTIVNNFQNIVAVFFGTSNGPFSWSAFQLGVLQAVNRQPYQSPFIVFAKLSLNSTQLRLRLALFSGKSSHPPFQNSSERRLRCQLSKPPFNLTLHMVRHENDFAYHPILIKL